MIDFNKKFIPAFSILIYKPVVGYGIFYNGYYLQNNSIFKKLHQKNPLCIVRADGK